MEAAGTTSALLTAVYLLNTLDVLQWVLVVINVIFTAPIPSRHMKDDKDEKIWELLKIFDQLADLL